MDTPDVPAPTAPGGSRRVTLQTFPAGTTLVTIGKVRADSHQRGGRRDHVARVAPTELCATLVTLGPGRYRVASLDPRGCFLRGGSFAVEVSAGSLEPTVVPPRAPGDYPRRPSTTAAARRGVQRLEQRVQALQAELREAHAANARLGRAAAAQREKDLKEAVGGHEIIETLWEQVERLVGRVKELEAREDARHKKGRARLAELREGLADERRQREADVARLAASAPSPGGAPFTAEQTSLEPVVERQGSAAVDGAQPSIGETPLPSASPSEVKDALTPGFAALASIRAVPRRNPASGERPSAPPADTPLTYRESLEAFLSQRLTRPK
jgi:chaperonin cofactor prefoldin